MKERMDGWALKKRIKQSKVYNYEIAEVLNITESALSKRLRAPTREQYNEILDAMAKIKGSKNGLV